MTAVLGYLTRVRMGLSGHGTELRNVLSLGSLELFCWAGGGPCCWGPGFSVLGLIWSLVTSS